jgi:hypothetical protein
MVKQLAACIGVLPNQYRCRSLALTMYGAWGESVHTEKTGTCVFDGAQGAKD